MLEAIEKQADWILDTVGIDFRGDDVALALFRSAGARVENQRVRMEPGQARALCASAPETFVLHARNRERSVTLGGDHVVLMPGYGSPFVTDLDRGRRYASLEDFRNFVRLTFMTPWLGQRSVTLGGDHVVLMPGYGSPFVTDLDRGRRYASLEDFRNFVRLTFMTPWLGHSGGTVCEPVDIPVNKRHLDMVLAHLTLSDKPFMGAVTTPQRARDSIDMARIAFSPQVLEDNAVIQANINVNSPLVYDATMSGALRVYAEANQCVAVSPSVIGGAMGPLTPAAICAQTLAEGMAGIALAQLVRPGCPCVLGSFHATMNLKSGALTFGTPEANLVTLALAQLGRRLRVPVRSGGGQITASNTPDGQAMQDAASAMWATMISGAHQIWHAAGWLEAGLTMSYEKFVMDVDHCGMMLRMLKGFRTEAEDLAADAYVEAAPGQNHLATAHTLRRYKTANFMPAIPEPGPWEAWTGDGSPRMEERANTVWKTMIESFEAPSIDDAVAEALDDFVARRKASMEDAWY